MGNKNYVKGRRKEYKIVNDFKEKGFEISQRTAGSHSPIDVIAIDKKTKRIKLIQAKPDSMSSSAKDKIEAENEWLNDEFMVGFKVL